MLVVVLFCVGAFSVRWGLWLDLVVCCLGFGICNMVRGLPGLWVSWIGIMSCFW